ncbi:hypothetical protein [Actinophytocola sp.]|uniref:hypothetical protein n=1 Tax=Actinophytocola sp. TaxID=1872138 RepID=UPI003899E1B1
MRAGTVPATRGVGMRLVAIRLAGMPLVAVSEAEVSNHHRTPLGVAVVAVSRRRAGGSRVARAVRPATTAVPVGGIPVATLTVVTPIGMAEVARQGANRGVVRLRNTADAVRLRNTGDADGWR